MPADDYYQLLGVSPKADAETIKSAYRAKLMQWHPDKNADHAREAEEMTKILNEAYHILGDPKRRKQYDRMRRYTANKDFINDIDEEEFKRRMKNARPLLNRMIDTVQEMYALFKDAAAGRYKLHPATLGMLGGGLLYLIMPLDFIPDFIPMVGLLDDIAILTVIMNSLKGELEKYRQWKIENAG